jgi:DNA (cytosine-5)-methyltransferase 1
MNELALFAGAGGGILGGQQLGWRTVCAVEWEPYPASVLAQRQNDGLLSPFPIWDDVRTFDGHPWRGVVDVVSGGFPCQDISVAGKGAGIDGERSGMWQHMARIIGEVRPRFAFVENSPAILTRGLGRVLGDLAALGYDCRWGVLGAADVGAPHQRDRFWLVAHTLRDGQQQPCSKLSRASQRKGFAKTHCHKWREVSNAFVAGGADVAHAELSSAFERSEPEMQRRWTEQAQQTWMGCCRSDCGVCNASSKDVEGQRNQSERVEPEFGNAGNASWWFVEPDVGRVANGVAARVDRLKAIGNGQVPLCAATAFRALSSNFDGDSMNHSEVVRGAA